MLLFTVRADSIFERLKIQRWLEDNDLPSLILTNKKDWEMQVLWDDCAIRVKYNIGEPCSEWGKESKFSSRCTRANTRESASVLILDFIGRATHA